MSPWILGFGIFFGYPLVFSAYLSFTHYDLLSAPRWIGTANYEYLFQQDQQIWPAVKNTLWMIGVSVPLNVLFAFGVALMLARARSGSGIFRTIFYLPALAPPVAATLGFVYILNPATGPVNSFLGLFGMGPLWFQSPVGEAVARPARPLGDREPADHLPRRRPRRPEASAGVGRARRRGRAAAALVRHRADDQSGHPVRRRHRRDPGPPVLHPGVRGRDSPRARPRRRVTRRAISATPRTRRSLPGTAVPERVPVLPDGLRLRDAMLLLAVSLAVTLVILFNSKRFVHYQGAR
jgi:hypothetical protein